MANFVVNISIALFILASIGAAAFTQIESTTVTAWSANAQLMWALIVVFAVLAVVLFILRKAGLFSNSDN